MKVLWGIVQFFLDQWWMEFLWWKKNPMLLLFSVVCWTAGIAGLVFLATAIAMAVR